MSNRERGEAGRAGPAADQSELELSFVLLPFVVDLFFFVVFLLRAQQWGESLAFPGLLSARGG